MAIERQRRRPSSPTSAAAELTRPAEIILPPTPVNVAELSQPTVAIVTTTVPSSVQTTQTTLSEPPFILQDEYQKRTNELLQANRDIAARDEIIRRMEAKIRAAAEIEAPAKPIPPMPKTEPKPEPEPELVQLVPDEETQESTVADNYVKVPVPKLSWSGAIILVLGLVIIWNLFGSTISSMFDREEQKIEINKPDDKPDNKPVVPVVDQDSAKMAAINLYKLYAADWQAKMEIMKAASKQQFESDDKRAEWINKEFGDRFALSLDPFLDSLSHVMSEKKEGEMAAIMAAAAIEFDVKVKTDRIEAAAKAIKK
jgi:hypothetical protein